MLVQNNKQKAVLFIRWHLIVCVKYFRVFHKLFTIALYSKGIWRYELWARLCIVAHPLCCSPQWSWLSAPCRPCWDLGLDLSLCWHQRQPGAWRWMSWHWEPWLQDPPSAWRSRWHWSRSQAGSLDRKECDVCLTNNDLLTSSSEKCTG